MSSNKLERITKNIEQMKGINARILEIETIATMAADKLIKSEFELKIKDLTEKEVPVKESFGFPMLSSDDLFRHVLGSINSSFPKLDNRLSHSYFSSFREI